MRKKFARSLTPVVSVTKETCECFFLNHVATVRLSIIYANPQDLSPDEPVFEVRHCTACLDELYVFLLDFVYQLYSYYLMGVEFGYEYDCLIEITPKLGKSYVVKFPLC